MDRDPGDELRRWKCKVAAWLHDPPEKAVVLFQDRRGHEGGTVRALYERLFGSDPFEPEIRRRADHWASAADRIDLPMEAARRIYNDFVREPQLVHPLRQEREDEREAWGRLDIASVADLQAHDWGTLQSASEAWLSWLVGDPAAQDLAKAETWRRIFLRLWRLAPDPPPAAKMLKASGDTISDELQRVLDETLTLDEWGSLWTLLPADTRCPDHSIWEHLRLSSAFAGAMASGTPALLAVSLGPVQSFIARSRSTSDLWAGSHLLATMAWEAMRVVCERYGPDAVVFPDLHRVPVVDLWVATTARGEIDEGDWRAVWTWAGKRWFERESDSNTLFVAALPNRFVAIVPEEDAEAIAGDITARVRGWVAERSLEAWERFCSEVGRTPSESERNVVIDTLKGFPEVAWACVPFPAQRSDGTMDAAGLRKLVTALTGEDEVPGVSGRAHAALQATVQAQGARLYRPNPGVTYPAVYDAAERLVAAAKASRTFEQRHVPGVRDTLGGDEPALGAPEPKDGERGKGWRDREKAANEVFERVRARKASWAKEGERLGPLGVLKRMWPTLFVREVEKALSKVRTPDASRGDVDIDRFVVSTHTMAWASSLDEALAGDTDAKAKVDALRRALGKEHLERTEEHAKHRRTSLPPRLHERLKEQLGDKDRRFVGAVPVLADELDEEGAFEEVRHLERVWGKVFGHPPEKYYALVLLDGDRMGRLLSGEARPTYGGILTDRVKDQLEALGLGAYLDAQALASPAYHVSLSAALNAFAVHVAPMVTERCSLGKVIYAGGDDLLAMSATRGLFELMETLRCGYSGHSMSLDATSNVDDPVVNMREGFVHEGRSKGSARLRRVLGLDATASMGVVVAHHKAPLGVVLRELRAAERRAKEVGGRDAFSVTLYKRGGGLTYLTCGWHLGVEEGGSRAVATMRRIAGAVGEGPKAKISRRAIYLACTWIEDLPDLEDANTVFLDMLETGLAHQFARQAEGRDGRELAEDLAYGVRRLVEREAERRKDLGLAFPARRFVQDLLTTAEFFARAERGQE